MSETMISVDVASKQNISPWSSSSSKILGFIFLTFLLFLVVHGEVHHYEFVVKEKNYTRLCETKSMLVVNDSFPGPEIRVHKRDTVYVNVHNQGYYGFTIHWHGVTQPRNPWFDGPEYITQCPIPPGTNFTYEVIFSEEEGTLWWHAHSDWTRASVHGAIVVLPALGTTFPFPQPDEEEIIVLASWYKGDLKEIVDEALETGTDLPSSDAYTINGQPGDLCPCSSETTYRRKIDYGKTYLLRILNANLNAEMFFAIAQHNLIVVGLDGAYIKPISTSYIIALPGQTMDVLFEANQPLGQYYMAARIYWTENSEVDNFDHVNATAIFEYNGNYTSPSSPSFPSTLPSYLDYFGALKFTDQIKSLVTPVNVPTNITTRMYITVSMNSLYCEHSGCDSDQQIATSLNNISWANPDIDVLQAYYRNISGVYSTDFLDQPLSSYNYTDVTFDPDIVYTGQARKVKVLNYNESVEIVFQGTNVLDHSMSHPMHLHGYSFYVVGYGFGNYDNETDPERFNLVDPPQVTTFAVPKNGWLAIRFIANNPGVWFWHCHFEKHLKWGMNAAFIVKNGGTSGTSMRNPPAYMPPCEVSLNSHVQDSDDTTMRKR